MNRLQIDAVNFPSWQAQIKGSKEWTLIPPPECYFKCTPLSTIIESGEVSEWYLRNAPASRYNLFFFL